jgi:5-methylcytosine-specific restriction endonuclease McrA
MDVYRKRFSKSKRQELIEKNESCPICGHDLLIDFSHVDHIIPLALGGDNAEENLQVVCHECHKRKTKKDIKNISKSNRIIKKHLVEKKEDTIKGSKNKIVSNKKFVSKKFDKTKRQNSWAKKPN